MWTIYYKGAYINGKIDSKICRITSDDGRFIGKLYKSAQSAKIAITKELKKGMTPSR